MKDASGHEHDDKGLFTGPGGGSAGGRSVDDVIKSFSDNDEFVQGT